MKIVVNTIIKLVPNFVKIYFEQIKFDNCVEFNTQIEFGFEFQSFRTNRQGIIAFRFDAIRFSSMTKNAIKHVTIEQNVKNTPTAA